MTPPFDDVCSACIPRDSLALLACLRVEPGLRACVAEQHAWLRWDAGNTRVLEAVMPIHDAQFYRLHDGRWHRFGHALPDFEFQTEQRYQALAHLLFPMPVQPMPVPTKFAPPLRLTLERDDRPRATTAFRCTLQTFLAWSDTVGTKRLAMMQGVAHRDEILVLGDELPLIENAARYWGQDVLIPIGYAPNHALAESVLRAAAQVPEDELLLWEPDRTATVSRALLAPLARANLRMRMREAQR